MTLPPERVLYAIAALAGDLLDRWPNYQTVEADLARATLSASGGDGRSNGVADPTGGIAGSHLAYWGTVENLENALTFLRDAQRRITLVQRDHAPLARHLESVAKAARCDGGWDPTCVNNAVRKGRCWRCIKAEQRAQEQHAVDMSTPSATNTAGCHQ